MDRKLYTGPGTAFSVIAREISQDGAIPFSRFMELALYSDGVGYYERSIEQVGREGDFFTSVSVGPFFGQLLAFQFNRWAGTLSARGPVRLIEAGAHNGQLARDILGATHAGHPALAEAEYWIVEPSAARKRVQAEILAEFPRVRWFGSWSAVHAAASDGVTGIIFSNELLDAMPIHRLSWNATGHRWEEIGVTLDGGCLTAVALAHPSVTIPKLPEELLDVLPDGYIVELCPEATRWWRQAAGVLTAGKLMTIDYGATIEELLNPGRTEGTLRAYCAHHLADPLDSPGDQDITAHVNFTELRLAGEAVGLKTESFTTQNQFLTAIARDFWESTRSWSPTQARQFQTLTHPEHLGRPFRVLVQTT